MLVLDILNPLWSVKVVRPWDKTKMNPEKPYIFMFNHLSNADPYLVVRLMFPVDCKYVAKGSLFNVPFGGWCLRNNGDLAVHFIKSKGRWVTDKDSIKNMMGEAAALLQRKQPIGVFPEGTRSTTPGKGLNPFKPGFFSLAVQEKAQIVPVALSGTENCWPVKSPFLGPATPYASVGDPIDSEGHTTESLMDEVFKVITEMREAHPDRVGIAKKN